MNCIDRLPAVSHTVGHICPWRWLAACLLPFIMMLVFTFSASASPLQDTSSWARIQPEPTTWSQNPVEVVVQAQDGDGLVGATAEYRYTTDGGTNWTNWLTSNLVYDMADTQHMTITVTLSSLVESATENKVHFRVRDDLSTMEYSEEYTLLVDATDPSAPQDLAASPSGWTNTDTWDLSWTNPSDASGIVRAYYRLDSAPSSPGDADGWQDGTDIATLTGLSVGSPGQHTFYVWLQDAAGHSDYSQYSSVNVWLDQQAPGSPTSLAVDPPSWTSTNDFTLTWTNPAQSQAPVQKAIYKFGSAPTSPADQSGERSGINIWRIENLAAPEGGEIPCYLWLQDAAGNADYTTAQMVTLYYSGGSAPTAPFAMQITPNTWSTTNSFDISWTNPSAASGIVAAWYTWDTAPTSATDGTRVGGLGINHLDDLTVSGQGAHALYVWLEDGAGGRDHNNNSQVTARFDTVAPETVPQYTPALPSSGWFNTSVTVDLVASDEHAGVDETRYRSSGLFTVGDTFTADDTRTWEFYSVDTAGNIETTKSLSVPIDKQPPTSSLILSPPTPAGGWYSETVTISITAYDTLSGWANASWYRLDGGALQGGTQIVVSESGVHNLTYYSRDIAGNQESQNSVNPVCRIDKNAPTVTATPNKTGEFLQPPVNVVLSALDPLSGIAQVQYRRQGETTWQAGTTIVIDGSGGDGEYLYQYRAIDAAGNISDAQTISVKIDGTYPALPTNLQATPAGWVNADGGFGLSWTNPSDYSGIAGVYYQIDQDPTVTYAPAFVQGSGVQSLSGLSVLADGPHRIYVWLEDGAGNSSQWSAASLASAFKLDRTAPTVSAEAQGPLGDDPLYFKGAVDITLNGGDTLSGVASFRYRVDSGAWQSASATGNPQTAHYTFTFNQQGRHSIEYQATDTAGNVSATQSLFVRIDSQAPDSPASLSVSPAAWGNTNSFEICWSSPADYSGIGTVYAKQGSPPTSPTDYDHMETLVGGQGCVSGITVDQEGATSVYVWLEDRAGNVNHTTALPVVLRYDITQPATGISPTATSGDNGYYVSPVALCLEPEDATSGINRTFYRINDGAQGEWQGVDIVIDQEGEYEIEYWSTDMAGNEERPHKLMLVKIDLFAPQGLVTMSKDYVKGSSVLVNWSGADTASGSGVERYAVRYRQGGCSPWQTWLASTANKSQTFTGMSANNFYSFGVQVKDLAGHTSPWTPDVWAPVVYAEGLGNSDFELQRLGAWVANGPLASSVVYAPSHRGAYSYVGRLAPDYGYINSCDALDGISVPVNGFASLSQLIQLPSATCDDSLMLSFHYRIETYDTALGLDVDDGLIKWFDPFLVHIRDINGVELDNVMPDGNFIDYQDWKWCKVYDTGWLYDSGWRTQVIDLTPWAGQRIWIDFRVWNYVDAGWPTWAFVDDVKLVPKTGRIVYLPLGLGTDQPHASGQIQERMTPEPDRPFWPEDYQHNPRWVPLGE